MRKIVAKRPRVVCFVGKGIWESFIRAAVSEVKTPKIEVVTSTIASSSTILARKGNDVTVATTSVAKTTKKTKASKIPFEAFDLQPYKIVHYARMYTSSFYCGG